MKKVELLAPAGNYESFLGAIHAGADAVYLGGSKFGARAYANNFTDEEICSALKYAHIYGKKVYLTVNTLVKETEFSEVYHYLKPFYDAGLDAVIVQDVGVFHAIGKWFQGLERHISTQMTVTGSYGASYFKEAGATRIVPARELSLDEIKAIKDECDIEIETFVHGAICYCYSGQCLFSSILGGRSGNRGRCAQPCRLPYRVDKEDKEKYLLSLKDMCTIEIIPELIESGIDSFKIEGRMKSPEYVAGVTAMYRKYIDKYYNQLNNNELDYNVCKKDMDRLRALYIRSEISEGYYHKHNGKSMITLENPSYSKKDDELAIEIRENYLNKDHKLPVQGKAVLYKGKPAQFSISCHGVTASANGNIVEEAVKQPLEESSVKKQLLKSGNTVFSFETMEVDMEQGIFMPVKALNDLRRMVFNKLEEKLIKNNGFEYSDRKNFEEYKTDKKGSSHKNSQTTVKLQVFVQNKEQLLLAIRKRIQRIYVSSDLLETEHRTEEYIKSNNDKISFYLAMPYILRKRDTNFLNLLRTILEKDIFQGVLIRNFEELHWLKEISYKKPIVTDANMYLWNHLAYLFYKNKVEEHYIPHELNYYEIEALTKKIGTDNLSLIVYGRIPMMITANCIAKTTKGCKAINDSFCSLIDRYHKTFPVYLNCRHCYNIIYNTIPLSLHQNITKLEKLGIPSLRLDFTTESESEADKVISYYESILSGNKELIKQNPIPFSEYTNGHFKRGVE